MPDIALNGKTVAEAPFPVLSDRVRRFRDASRTRGARADLSPKHANLTRAFFKLYECRPSWERYARAMAYALENEPVHLFDDELLVGMLYQGLPGHSLHKQNTEKVWEPHNAWQQMLKRQEQEVDPRMVGCGYPGHVGWRWDLILERGIQGHMDLVRDCLAEAKDAKAKRLYRGAITLWRSVLRWNARHVAALRRKAERAAGRQRKRIEQVLQICERVPRYPARTFHEAVQSFYSQYLAVMFENPYGGNGPGQLDYFLWPYLKRDLASGETTMQEAKELIDELFIRLHERLQQNDYWVEAVVLGGAGPDGASSVNPLSYLMLDSIAALDQTHPAVYCRLSRDTPEDFVDLNVEYLLHGQNRAQIYNDEACLRAIQNRGVPFQDAAMYMAGGCMEISVQGMNCDLNWACVHNVAKTLELVLNGGVDSIDGTRRTSHERDLSHYADFEDLYAAFEAALARDYEQMLRALDIASECYARYRPCYLLSSLTGDCLERGREQQDGGARYHDYGFAPLAITSAADSLSAIKRAVFDMRFLSASEMLAALRANFTGYEALQARLKRLPKFGVEDPESDTICDRVLKSVCSAAARQRTRFGGKLKPMIFNFVWTPELSRELGARADGSPAGDTIGQGMTPRSCAMTMGLTAAMNSSTSLSYEYVSGGATTMWDMDDQWINFDLMKSLLKTFMARGGMIFHGNTTSVEDLKDAFEHPEKYPDLIVRVGGFSARFVTLGRDVQREIIERRRHRG